MVSLFTWQQLAEQMRSLSLNFLAVQNCLQYCQFFLTYRKLNELLLEREADNVKQKRLQQREGVVSKENQVLKSKLNQLRLTVAKKTTHMAELEGKCFSCSLVNSSLFAYATYN